MCDHRKAVALIRLSEKRGESQKNKRGFWLHLFRKRPGQLHSQRAYWVGCVTHAWSVISLHFSTFSGQFSGCTALLLSNPKNLFSLTFPLRPLQITQNSFSPQQVNTPFYYFTITGHDVTSTV